MNYYLIGIGGTGMSALAQILVHKGHGVTGSDRNKDFELNEWLQGLGVGVFKQDGSGLSSAIDKVIISRAVEDSNPDMVKAKELSLPVCFRQDVLKELFRDHSGIAVAGTSGKTTVVGMIGSIMEAAGYDLTIINGGVMKNYDSNVRIGKDPFYCIETDESEGNLDGYSPRVGVLTNIGADHMSSDKLINVYRDFASAVKDVLVVNNDTELDIEKPGMITYGIKNDSDLKATNVKLLPNSSEFTVDGCKIEIKVPGLYNIYNALAALGAAWAWGISTDNASNGLSEFIGIKRRFDILGEKNRVTVIDDFAHNPDKIRSTLETVRIGRNRIIAVYQPQGYRPTKMFFNELVDVFAGGLMKTDCLFMPEIYYAGGTTEKDVSSRDLIEAIKKRNNYITTKYFHKRDDIIGEICTLTKSGDTVLVMGARDNTLTEFGYSILNAQ